VRAEGLRQYHVMEQEIAGLIGTETRHPPLFDIPKHAHDLPSFYVVLEGHLTEVSDRNKQDLDTCSVVFTPAGEIHSNTFHRSGGRCFLVELRPDWTDRLTAADINVERSLAADQVELTRLALRLYQEFRYTDKVSPLSIEGLTLEILAAFARQGQKIPGAHRLPGSLRAARDVIHDRFSETMTLADIAAQTGLAPIQLMRGFRKYFRCSPAEYQRRLRVEHASRMLATTARPLAAIAAATGFADQAHFSRMFKRHTGLTPAQYRVATTVR
jgi:AraC family transcriptional regulator